MKLKSLTFLVIAGSLALSSCREPLTPDERQLIEVRLIKSQPDNSEQYKAHIVLERVDNGERIFSEHPAPGAVGDTFFMKKITLYQYAY